MKCLEKDRTRRYETANGLAQDLSGHLDTSRLSPVLRCTAYRSRRRGDAIGWRLRGGAVAAALVIGIRREQLAGNRGPQG